MQSNKITEWQTITKRIHLRSKNIVKSLLTFFCEKHLVAKAISLLRITTKLFTAIYSKVQKLFRKCFSLWGPPEGLWSCILYCHGCSQQEQCVSSWCHLFYNSSSTTPLLILMRVIMMMIMIRHQF